MFIRLPQVPEGDPVVMVCHLSVWPASCFEYGAQHSFKWCVLPVPFRMLKTIPFGDKRSNNLEKSVYDFWKVKRRREVFTSVSRFTYFPL